MVKFTKKKKIFQKYHFSRLLWMVRANETRGERIFNDKDYLTVLTPRDFTTAPQSSCHHKNNRKIKKNMDY